MSESRFRLDTVVAELLHGLEHERAALATRHKEPRALAAALRKALEEHLGLKEREYRAWGMWDEKTWGIIEKEALDVVLPQYVSYAIGQTEIERHDYRIWRGGDVFSRIAYVLAAAILSAMVLRIPELPKLVEEPLAVGFVLGSIFLPELQRFYFRWTYARRMNRLIREAGRQQAVIERYALVDALEQVGRGGFSGGSTPSGSLEPGSSGAAGEGSTTSGGTGGQAPPERPKGGQGETVH